jgi:hypothetical protein
MKHNGLIFIKRLAKKDEILKNVSFKTMTLEEKWKEAQKPYF